MLNVWHGHKLRIEQRGRKEKIRERECVFERERERERGRERERESVYLRGESESERTSQSSQPIAFLHRLCYLALSATVGSASSGNVINAPSQMSPGLCVYFSLM